MEAQRVVLVGNSLLLAGVETCLTGRADLEVVRVDSNLPEAAPRLKLLHPSVIIFDLSEARVDSLPVVSCLIRNHPGVLVLGLDLTNHEVMVLSGQQHPAVETEDLIAAFQTGIGHDFTAPRAELA